MDKVREILAVLKKHHFWIFSVVVTGTILGCWYKAKGSLSQMYATEKSAIETARSGLESIRSDTNHPNPTYKEGVEKERESLKQKTDAEWQRLYERQKSVFTWPKELREFTQWEEGGRKTPMTRQMLQLYLNFIDEEFPRLEKLVDMRREKNPQGGGTGAVPGAASPYPGASSPYPGGPRPGSPYGGGGGAYGTPGMATVEMVGIVDWDLADYTRLKGPDGLKTWGTRTPEQIEVLLCHESLAVYRSLLKAIAKCNEKATDNDNAVVKQILALDIGRHASNPGRFDAVQNVIMPGEIAEASSGLSMASSIYSQRPQIVGAEGEVIPKEQLLLQDRYVDGAGKPVDATAATTSPPFAEFKLMKVRLALVVDQKGIPQLLANLANADLSVEVHQVRINPLESTIAQSVRGNLLGGVGGGAGGYPGGRPGGGYPGPGGGGGGYPGPTGGGYPGPGGSGSRSVGRPETPPGYGGGGYSQTSSSSSTNDATIEIKGIIYIYNPFDPAKTGTGTDTTEASARGMAGFAGAGDAAAAAPTAEAVPQ